MSDSSETSKPTHTPFGRPIAEAAASTPFGRSPGRTHNAFGRPLPSSAKPGAPTRDELVNAMRYLNLSPPAADRATVAVLEGAPFVRAVLEAGVASPGAHLESERLNEVAKMLGYAS